MHLIDRPEYLNLLKRWAAQSDLAKIVTGVRRCGKSKLFELFQNYLLSIGIKDKQIISINLEDDIQTQTIGLVLNDKTGLLDGYAALVEYVLGRAAKHEKTYIFLDEIQLLDNWQRAANTLRLQNNFDVYLTGSNAHMFSSDLHNFFGGRFIEIKMQPLSFKEYVSYWSDRKPAQTSTDMNRKYEDYVNESSFPQTISFRSDKEMIKMYLMDSVYNNTIQKDIIGRFGISNPVRLHEIAKFVFDNISNPTSLLGIHRMLKASKIEIAPTTLNNYIKGFLDSYLVYKCEPYDIKGKRILESESKYYVCDIGLRGALLGRPGTDVGRALENVVYLELLRRGYTVTTGKIGDKEVDFVAKKPDGVIEYYQVAWMVFSDDGAVLRRELASLEAIRDNYPKYLITMDIGSNVNNGIKRLNALEWLMDKVE